MQKVISMIQSLSLIHIQMCIRDRAWIFLTPQSCLVLDSWTQGCLVALLQETQNEVYPQGYCGLINPSQYDNPNSIEGIELHVSYSQGSMGTDHFIVRRLVSVFDRRLHPHGGQGMKIGLRFWAIPCKTILFLLSIRARWTEMVIGDCEVEKKSILSCSTLEFSALTTGCPVYLYILKITLDAKNCCC